MPYGTRQSVGATPGGEPLWPSPKDLAHSFQCEEDQTIGLNMWLPRITQRDVLPNGRLE